MVVKYQTIQDDIEFPSHYSGHHESDKAFIFNSDPLAQMGCNAMSEQHNRPSTRTLGANARFLAVGNQAGTPLEQFVLSTFGAIGVYPVTDDNLRGFSSQLGDYGIIIALVDDVARAKRVFRAIKVFAQTKLCYAIMTHSTPHNRAALVRFVFDDVFDTRMTPTEILLRIQSQCNRQAQYDSALNGDAAFKAFCEQNFMGGVHGLHFPVLRRLFDNMGHVARYCDLAAYDYHSGEFRLDSLTVRIHNLRRRLKNYEIRCERGVGYALVKCAAWGIRLG